ncbi:MAG: hypothetical protein AB1Z98_16730 [Nannocystaceae bacterium]
MMRSPSTALLSVLTICTTLTACDPADAPALDTSLRASDADEQLLAAQVELSEEAAQLVDEALSDDSEPSGQEISAELVEMLDANIAELVRLDPRIEEDLVRAIDLHDEMAAAVVELAPGIELQALGGDLPPTVGFFQCALAPSYISLVQTLTVFLEQRAKASHQQFGASYSWITWFMTIVARIDADYAKSWGGTPAAVLANKSAIVLQMYAVGEETQDAATFGAISYQNDPNFSAGLVKDLAPSTAKLAFTVADLVKGCSAP